eukprot:590301_1
MIYLYPCCLIRSRCFSVAGVFKNCFSFFNAKLINTPHTNMQNNKPNLILIKVSGNEMPGDNVEINHLFTNINNTPSILNSFNIFNLQLSGSSDGITAMDRNHNSYSTNNNDPLHNNAISNHNNGDAVMQTTHGNAFRGHNHTVSRNTDHLIVIPFVNQSQNTGIQSQNTATSSTKDKDGIDRFKCDLCLKRFRHKSNLKVHQKIHGSTAYECDFCQRKFARQSNLLQHRRVHTNERPFKCDQCGQAFKQRHSLLDHVRRHSGERPFKCDYCDKRFTVKHNMVVHRRIHTGEKPYQCTVCSKRFTSKSGLNQHSKTHKNSH